MYKKLLSAVVIGLMLMVSACSGGIEEALKAALNNDKKRMQICGSRESLRTITIDGLHKTKIRIYPIEGADLGAFWDDADHCFGSRSVTNIVEYTTPSDFGGMKMTEVVFDYDMEFNDLARNLRVDNLIRDAYGKPHRAKAVLVETNNGWRVRKITWSTYNLFDKVKIISSEKYGRELSPNCAACQDMMRDGVDFTKLPKEIVGKFRDKNHFSEACASVRESCSRQYGVRY